MKVLRNSSQYVNAEIRRLSDKKQRDFPLRLSAFAVKIAFFHAFMMPMCYKIQESAHPRQDGLSMYAGRGLQGLNNQRRDCTEWTLFISAVAIRLQYV
jgi:hypothetical protein